MFLGGNKLWQRKKTYDFYNWPEKLLEELKEELKEEESKDEFN